MPVPSANASSLCCALIESLPPGNGELFNPYRDTCQDDQPHNDGGAKRERLAYHLDCDPEFILVGEAPSYRGCRHSGVAFTSERLLMEDGSVPRIPRVTSRLTVGRRSPVSEASATVVWRTLHRLGIAETTVLWNALQLHPHELAKPRTNRTPKKAELKQGKAALTLLKDAFPRAKLVAVGRLAQAALKDLGFDSPRVRHPANRGADEFAAGLEEFMKR